MAKVIYLTGAPASGKSSTTRALAEASPGLMVWEYGARLTEHVRNRSGGIADQGDLREQSARIVTPADVEEVDRELLKFVFTHRDTANVIIDSHPVTKESFGFRITPFSLEQFKELAPDEIWVLYASPEVTIARITADAAGRPMITQAGISRAAIDAAWPSWWSDEAGRSPSGRAELRFALARRLGLEAKELLGERVEFVWNDEARFKHLSTQGAAYRAALTSYSISIGRLLLRATPEHAGIDEVDVTALREAILAGHNYVDLQSLIATCWALGIPVVHLRIFPLDTKSMHAMVVTVDGRFAILLGRDASYPAPVAFTLAHELGHIVLRHLEGTSALIDLEDSATAKDADNQEREADEFALTLLTGSSDPDIQTNVDTFNAASLAAAVLDAGPRHRIEPGKPHSHGALPHGPIRRNSRRHDRGRDGRGGQ